MKIVLPADHYGLKARTCNTCGEYKQPDEFHVISHKGSAHGVQVYKTCKSCEKTRKLDNHLQNTYGITLADFNRMNEEQNGKCFLCGNPPSGKSERLVVDHCHTTGSVRKLLCVTCNVQLAKFEADPSFADRIMQYLSDHR